MVSWIFSDLMAVLIWVRFSGGGAAVAEVGGVARGLATCRLAVGRALGVGGHVAALPVVVAALAVAALGLHVLAALGESVSECMLLDFSPCMRLPS